MENKFIFFGNGTYLNKGCEAITRGTIDILDKTCNASKFLSYANASKSGTNLNISLETDNRIVHIPKSIHSINRASVKLLEVLNLFDFYKIITSRDLKKHISEAKAILSMGGDNYSLDYGVPYYYEYGHEACLESGKPVVLWGASVGPFTRNKVYEDRAKKHLNKLTAIFARESASLDYLDSIGVRENVYGVADPAFYMIPAKPELHLKSDSLKKSIGINFSPLLERYWYGKNSYREYCRNLCLKLLKETDYSLVFVPHVTIGGNNDEIYMKGLITEEFSVFSDRLIFIPGTLNAREVKWIIGKLDIFIGARTHATIAAISSAVPTLSLSYSIKSLGINRDIFGNEDYCISPGRLGVEDTFDRVKEMQKDNLEIREFLLKRAGEMKIKAERAGVILSGMIN